ncbi:MAG: hypothetical protein ACOCWA_06715 [Bacteroidota bacterium]
MVKNSTIFFIYDNINEENELYSHQELTEPGRTRDDFSLLLDKIEFNPPDRILQRIFEKAF